MNNLYRTTIFIFIFLFSYSSAYTQVACQDFDVELISSNISPQADGYYYVCPGETLQLSVSGGLFEQ